MRLINRGTPSEPSWIASSADPCAAIWLSPRPATAQAMVHVPGDAGGVERRQLAADGDALIHLPHLRQPEV